MKKRKGKHTDFPWDEVCKSAEQLALDGHLVYQKWTCAGCGARIGSSRPNYFTEQGRCEEPGCGHITNIKKQGCNYMVIASSDPRFLQMLHNKSNPNLN